MKFSVVVAFSLFAMAAQAEFPSPTFTPGPHPTPVPSTPAPLPDCGAGLIGLPPVISEQNIPNGKRTEQDTYSAVGNEVVHTKSITTRTEILEAFTYNAASYLGAVCTRKNETLQILNIRRMPRYGNCAWSNWTSQVNVKNNSDVRRDYAQALFSNKTLGWNLEFLDDRIEDLAPGYGMQWKRTRKVVSRTARGQYRADYSNGDRDDAQWTNLTSPQCQWTQVTGGITRQRVKASECAGNTPSARASMAMVQAVVGTLADDAKCRIAVDKLK